MPVGQSFRLLRWDRNVRDVSVVLGDGRMEAMRGEGTRWHSHVEMELTCFLSGQGTRFVGDHIGGFGPGDVVLLGALLPHHWHARGESSGISVQWHFPPGHPFWAFPETQPLEKLFTMAARGMRFSGRTAADAAGRLSRLAGAAGATRLGLLMELLGALAAAPAGECRQLSARAFDLAPDSGHHEAVARAIRHLIAHHREPVRLADLLRVTGLSRPTFARQFRKHAGRSFSEFLNRLRLQSVIRELADPRRSITEAALACGFSQISFFNRAFRRQFGCSPSIHRQRSARAAARDDERIGG